MMLGIYYTRGMEDIILMFITHAVASTRTNEIRKAPSSSRFSISMKAVVRGIEWADWI